VGQLGVLGVIEDSQQEKRKKKQ